MNSATESLLADIRDLEPELLEMVDEPETISCESDLFTPTPQDVFNVILRDFKEVAAWNPTLSPDELLDLFGKEAGMRIKCWEEARNLNGRGGQLAINFNLMIDVAFALCDLIRGMQNARSKQERGEG